jgi:hypothetical protein
MAWDPFPWDGSLLPPSFTWNRQIQSLLSQQIGLAEEYLIKSGRQTGVEACISTWSVKHKLS